MGRRKIEIQPITHERNRSVTFLKRKNGLFKKAYELGVLCSVDVAIVIFNPAGTSNKLFEFTSTDLDSLIRRRAEFQGERDLKTTVDFSGDAIRTGQGKGNGGVDSDEDDDDSDVPVSGAKGGAQSSKRRVSGTKSRPARNTGLSNLHDEKPDIDELEHDTALSHSTTQRSPNPHLQANASDDEPERSPQDRHRRESAARSTMNPRSGHRDQHGQDGRGSADSWPSPRSSNRQLPGGYSNTHDLLLGNFGLPFSLGHLASQLTPQQISNLAPHLGALASQQQQLNSLSPQHQELLALHAVKQQQQQLHLQQREQLASLQNSLRGTPNRLATLNLNLSGLGNLSNLGSLGNLANVGGLGERDLGALGLGSALSGLPIRKMGLGGSGGFPPGLTSVTSSGTAGGSGHTNGNSTHSSFNQTSLSSNNSFNSNGNASQEQGGGGGGGGGGGLSSDDGSWLDFLSLPAGRLDPSSLSSIGPLSSLNIGGLVERHADRSSDSAVRSQPDSASSLFGMNFGSANTSSNPGNSSFASGVASGGGYGLGVGLGPNSSERGRRTPIERSASRGEAMDLDKDSDRGEQERDRRGRSAENDERERDDESHSRKRARWE